MFQRFTSTTVQLRKRNVKTIPGIIFDIDGVLLRGGNVLPQAKTAFTKLNNLSVPIAFVTNAGNSHREEKAEILSEKLNVPISSSQVVMSHTPLSGMDAEYYSRFSLISGQGPIRQIADRLGFKNVITIDELRAEAPFLDMVNQTTRPVKRKTTEKLSFSFPKIEQIILFGEPDNWDRNLQLLIDCIISNGDMWQEKSQQDYEREGVLGAGEKHIPILAANMDLQWQAEAPGPRFGHGTFMTCLESIYGKITGGKDLVYSALAGKPGVMTYEFSEKLLEDMALEKEMRLGDVFCIGDNLMSDIYGANLYSQRISARNFVSMLVCTGVYHPPFTNDLEKLRNTFDDGGNIANFHHAPRDFIPNKKLLKPNIICHDVDHCVDYILKQIH